ncbi:MAG: molybdate ABC transporter substrate-binding protein [Pseudoruegeria sp.]
MTRLCALLLGVLLTVTPVCAEKLTIFAASSLKTALDQVNSAFQERHPHPGTVTASYAGSAVLARQIQLGAPADLYISAHPDWMGVLHDGGYLHPGSMVDLLGNNLVLVSPASSEHVQLDLQDVGLIDHIGSARVAMGLVEAVPAGQYGKAALNYLGLWDAVQGQVVQTDNVRSALALAALGEVGFAVVYASDAVAETRVQQVAIFPRDSYPEIRYSAAVIADADLEFSSEYLKFLQSAEAIEIFISYGFEVLNHD